jgi:FAD/FMN-containing dehydrogenase
MQSYSNFSVGGSLSVNCHGRYVGAGPVANSVRALQLVTAAGEVLECDRTRHADLFAAVIGGYGGLGAIAEVELDLAQDVRMRRDVERVALADYPAWFRANVLADPDAVLHNADLVPPAFDAPLAITWRRTDAPATVAEHLVPVDADYGSDQKLIWAASELPAGSSLRAYDQDRMLAEPAPVVWRNHEASLDADSLEPATRAFSTWLLQEYFSPVEAFAPFAHAMAALLRREPVHALNVSIRHSPADPLTLLRWAPRECFSFVLYHKQRRHRFAEAQAKRWTQELVELALEHGGRHYLPYRLHATQRQFLRAYPGAVRYAELKREWDPQRRWRNALLDAYLPA